MNEWKNEQINEWTNKWINKWHRWVAKAIQNQPFTSSSVYPPFPLLSEMHTHTPTNTNTNTVVFTYMGARTCLVVYSYTDMHTLVINQNQWIISRMWWSHPLLGRSHNSHTFILLFWVWVSINFKLFSTSSSSFIWK